MVWTAGRLCGAVGLILCGVTGMVRADTSFWYDKARLADFRAGIFCLTDDKYPVKEPDTMSGEIDIYNDTPIMVRETRVIPALEQIAFGTEERSRADEDIELLITIEHPALGHKQMRRESWRSSLVQDSMTSDFFILGLSDGDPVGHWAITGSENGRTLFRVNFEVVPPKSGEVSPCVAEMTS